MIDTPTRTKRFANALDCVLVALLFVEGLLFLSDKYDWFAFNRRKGWTVLVAVGVVGGTLLLTGLWAVLSWVISRWMNVRPFQFGLRSGMLLVAVVGLACGWLGAAIRQARQQAEICAAIQGAGSQIRYEQFLVRREPLVVRLKQLLKGDDPPSWTTRLLGVDFFSKVEQAGALNDRGLLKIVRLSDIEDVQLDGWIGRDAPPASRDLIGFTSFSKEALSQIQKLTRLKRLYLDVGEWPASDIASIALPNSLEELSLGGDNLDDTTLAMIATLPELRVLCLHRSWPFGEPCKITDEGLRHLSGLAKLQRLELFNTSLSDAGLVHLEGLSELRELSIESTQVNHRGFRSGNPAIPSRSQDVRFTWWIRVD